MSDRVKTVVPKDVFSVPIKLIQEPPTAYDWHTGESSMTKMTASIYILRQGGNLNPTEAQIKANYIARGGKTTT